MFGTDLVNDFLTLELAMEWFMNHSIKSINCMVAYFTSIFKFPVLSTTKTTTNTANFKWNEDA